MTSLIYGILNTTEHIEVNGMMTTELERTWMKVIMTYLEDNISAFSCSD